MIQDLVIALVTSLVATIVLETGFFLLLKKRNKQDLLLLVLVNVMTNPMVVLLYWLALFFTTIHPFITVALLEVLAVLVEGHYYKRYGEDFSHPYVFSLLANTFSYGIGALVQYFI